VKFQTLSTSNIEAYSLPTKGIIISMATSIVHPFEIWVGTSMLFNGGGTNPPHRTNNAFALGCAFEHIAISVHPLLSYR
jgi:hypothetical protein